MTVFTTYQQIIALSPLDLIQYLETFKLSVSGDINNSNDADTASRLLNKISNNYSFLSSLLSIAKATKRSLARTGRISEYEDMIDKEAVIDNLLRAIDIQYRALSKTISLYMEEHKEYYGPSCR